MTITVHQIMLVEKTFRKIAGDFETVAASFYARLFDIDPALRPLFKGNLQEQGRKLMQMLAVIVGSLHRLDSVVPVVQALGARHVRYGVKKQDYDTVGGALLWALGEALGREFTPEVEAAWTAVYVFLMEAATADAYPAEMPEQTGTQ